MNAATVLKKFLRTSTAWEQALDAYTDDELTRKPSADAWSIGQVYMHLLRGSQNFQLKQIELCLAGDDNADGQKTPPGRLVMFINAFPPMRVAVPPSPEYTPPQPESKEQLHALFAAVNSRMNDLAARIDAGGGKGKTRHPALGWLDALEWFRLIDQHFRHHLRQKRRLDTFLGKR